LNPQKTKNLDYRRLVREGKKAEAVHSLKMRIALLSDAATQQFVPVLKALFHENGVSAEVYEGAFDAMELETINPASGLYGFEPGVVVVVSAGQALRSRFYEHGMEGEAARIVRVWDAIQGHCSARIVQCNVAVPQERHFGSFDLKVEGSFYSRALELNARIAECARERSNVLLCDMESVASYIGRRHWFDERLWNMSKTFCALEHLPAAAQAIVDVTLSSVGRVVKCVVADLDNTLWGGIVGDDGPLGIEVGPHGDGEAFYHLQKYLLALKRRGILLAVCSKNDPANAVAPFAENPGMALKREDITVFIANWENKADNLRTIRDTLEIGFDSMVFLDDNPFERNLVREMLPDVIVPELPEDPADYVRVICELNLFETASFSAEDTARAELYQREAERREAAGAYSDITEFLKSLEMKIAVERFSAAQIPRIAQLLQRSNQFNLTTHRYNEAECEAMMRDEARWLPLHASLSDKFGEHGLISIVIARFEEEELRITDWLMSCRVLSRGVEQFLMNRMFAVAREKGLARVTGEFVPTAKNGMVKDFWRQFGFTSEDGRTWMLAVESYEPRTVWMR
jgi:FkbH-like protein